MVGLCTATVRRIKLVTPREMPAIHSSSRLLPVLLLWQGPGVLAVLGVPLDIGETAIVVDHADWTIWVPFEFCRSSNRKGLVYPLFEKEDAANIARTAPTARSIEQRLFELPLRYKVIEEVKVLLRRYMKCIDDEII